MIRFVVVSSRWGVLGFLVALFGLVSCGGADDAGPDGVVIEAAGGRASLTVDPASLPEGVAVSDISIRAAFDDTPGPGEPLAAVQLSPAGLMLSSPATLTIELDQVVEGTLLVVHSSGDGLGFVTGEVSDRDGRPLFVTEIEHFSRVALIARAVWGVTSTVETTDMPVTQGEEVQIDFRFEPAEGETSLWVQFPSDDPGTSRLLTVSAPMPPFQDGEIWIDEIGGEEAGNWSPSRVSWTTLTRRPQAWEHSVVTECLKPNQTGAGPVMAWLPVTLTLISLSEPQPAEFIRVFAELGPPEALETPRMNDRLEIVLDLSPGDSFAASLGIWLRGLSMSCVGEGGATTTTSGGIPESEVADGTEVTISDLPGDFLTAEELNTFPQLEENPPPGIDITDVSVVYNRDEMVTEVTICFGGRFQDLEADQNRRITVRPVFTSGGSYLFEAQYSAESVFLSSAPEGASLSHRWLSPSKIRFRIDGFAPAIGDTVRINVFSELTTSDGKAVQGDRAEVAITE